MTGITGLHAHLEKNHKQVTSIFAKRKLGQSYYQMSSRPQELHAKLVNFIVTDDQSINIVECPEFWSLLLLLHEDLRDKNVPCHTQLHSLVIKSWQTYFEHLKTDLQAALGKISFMGDIWSDQCLHPFFAITAH
ncbi:hypothetical protein BDN71DRAFT_1435048 [Pleurotus eryngii]|uniref:Uncharacterized protein n=1 Tax=Pleurotus eryngii TaxID=5323 RepID=A0A9P6DBN9_PLEER|nr:hypothetical protein BDN71DRAFT_1435048 [Pleurotus eryngii]